MFLLQVIEVTGYVKEIHLSGNRRLDSRTALNSVMEKNG